MSKKEAASPPTTNRRTFLGRLWLVLGLAAAAQLLAGIFAFLFAVAGRRPSVRSRLRRRRLPGLVKKMHPLGLRRCLG